MSENFCVVPVLVVVDVTSSGDILRFLLFRISMPSGNNRVFLGNLPSDCRVEDIEDFFRYFLIS
jgi:hypothetical protein